MLFDLFRSHFGRLPLGLDGPTVTRGEAVFKAGRVLSVRERTPGVLDAEVEGSNGETYRTTLRLTLSGTGMRVGSSCSCPVAHDCKHGVAMLIGWLLDLRDGVAQPAGAADEAIVAGRGARAAPARAPDGPGRAVEAAVRPTMDGYERLRVLDWVRELRALKLPDGAPEPVAGSALCYVLRGDPRRPSLLVFRIRRRADGQPGEPEQYPSLAAHAHAPPPFWDHSDAQAATLLSGSPPGPAGSSAGIPLDGPRAQDVLLLLARAGKLYLEQPPQRDDPPLACGEPRPAAIAWLPAVGATEGVADGTLRLGLRPEPQADTLYTLQPCWLDRAALAIGPIASPPPAALCAWMRTAPAVSPDATDEVALALHAQLRARPALRDLIPGITGGPVRERAGVPRPVLGLFTLRPRGPVRAGQKPVPAGRETLAVSYAVEYEGRRMEPLRATSIGARDDEGPVLVTCDPQAERAALSALRDALRDASLGADDALAFAPPPAPDTAGARPRGGSGWLTVATLPAATVTAARIKFDVAQRLAAQGWAVVDEAELPLDVLVPDAVSIDLRAVEPTGVPDGSPRLPRDTPAGGVGWFELQSGIQVAGRRIDLAPILAQLIAGGGFEA